MSWLAVFYFKHNDLVLSGWNNLVYFECVSSPDALMTFFCRWKILIDYHHFQSCILSLRRVVMVNELVSLDQLRKSSECEPHWVPSLFAFVLDIENHFLALRNEEVMLASLFTFGFVPQLRLENRRSAIVNTPFLLKSVTTE